MMTPQGLQIGSPEDSLARLGIITNGIVIVNIVFRVRIADCRRVPVRIQASRICSSSMDCSSCCLAFISSALCNETRDARFHHFIEPLPCLNAIDFIERVFRKGGDVEIFPRASRSFGRGKHSRAALHRPCQQHLCRRLSNSCGDCRNDRIFEQPRLHPMTQWRESQKHNALLLAEFQKLRFRQIRMGFDLDHGRLDSCRFIDGQQFLQADVGQSDGPASAMVHETFHCSPGIEQSHSVVVEDIAVLISRVLVVSRLKCKRSVNEVEIQIVEPESSRLASKAGSTRSGR